MEGLIICISMFAQALNAEGIGTFIAWIFRSGTGRKNAMSGSTKIFFQRWNVANTHEDKY